MMTITVAVDFAQNYQACQANDNSLIISQFLSLKTLQSFLYLYTIIVKVFSG